MEQLMLPNFKPPIDPNGLQETYDDENVIKKLEDGWSAFVNSEEGWEKLRKVSPGFIGPVY